MILVPTPKFVIEQTEATKSVFRNMLTNFYFNKDRLDYWTRLGLLFHEKIGETSFFFRKDEDFFHLFYVSASGSDLGRGLEELSVRPEILMADIITKTGEMSPAVDIFQEHSFRRYNTLARMCMTKDPVRSGAGLSDGVRFAQKDEVGKIHDIMTGHFDRYAEQIPSVDEIASDIENSKIIVMEQHGTIEGLIHYELAGLTSHLRRWFVDPDFRDHHVGSRLLRSYFSLSRKATRFILWVLESNENAISRYLHYGYRKDNLIDAIFINKEQVQCGK